MNHKNGAIPHLLIKMRSNARALRSRGIVVSDIIFDNFNKVIIILIKMNRSNPWNVVLGISIILVIVSIATFPPLYHNISGDGVPNRTQREPPIIYQWDSVIQRIIMAVLFAGIAVYSYNQTKKDDFHMET